MLLVPTQLYPMLSGHKLLYPMLSGAGAAEAVVALDNVMVTSAAVLASSRAMRLCADRREVGVPPRSRARRAADGGAARRGVLGWRPGHRVRPGDRAADPGDRGGPGSRDPDRVRLRALAVAERDSELTDLRLLLRINQAVPLSDLDRYSEAMDAVGQVRQEAERTGSVVRLSQAQSAMGQLLLDTERIPHPPLGRPRGQFIEG